MSTPFSPATSISTPRVMTTSSSLLARRFTTWFMNVRLVWTSKRRVPTSGIVALRT